MDSRQELSQRLAEAQIRLNGVREEILVTGLPMTPAQRRRLDQAKLNVRAAKGELEAALGEVSR